MKKQDLQFPIIVKFSGLDFICTCQACPEQYDVKDRNGNMVGYVRLRHGELTCEYPDADGEIVYDHIFEDDRMGCFDHNEQRQYHLKIVADKIIEKIKGTEGKS